MNFIKRTNLFIELGRRLKNIDLVIYNEFIEQAFYKNPWFTAENIKLSFNGLIRYLEEDKIRTWLKRYDFTKVNPKNVGIVMAGNIPLVGVHDMICVLLSGNRLVAKLSSQDEILIPLIADELEKIDPEIKNYLKFVDKLKEVDAVIATGSDNTSRYFHYYFSKIPNIIRKNRTSIAVLNGDEKPDELKLLGTDVFSYFGLGCRNVSKIFIPEGYDIKVLISSFENFNHLINHNKYNNNYSYQRSIFLVNMTKHLDSGFALYQQCENLVSPISIIYYDYYKDIDSLKNLLLPIKNKIQCIVSRPGLFDESVKFGNAQNPEIWDYADNIDTMKFLCEI